MNKVAVAVVGAGPYGLSLAAHLAARKVQHRIFGRPMQFWSQVAGAGRERYLRTYCFGTNISSPNPGFMFADYSGPRGLETFEPCSIGDFAAYGQWFQKENVPWVEPVDVALVSASGRVGGFTVTLADGQSLLADRVIVAVGLGCFAVSPASIAKLPPALAAHTSVVTNFAAFEGRDVAVIGAGQSALEAAALLLEAGARPQLVVRKNSINWMDRVPKVRSFWRRLRSPVSALGSGPKAWAISHFPGAIHRLPDAWRSRLMSSYLPPAGAWWLRSRIGQIPVHTSTTVEDAWEENGRVALTLKNKNGFGRDRLVVDHVIAGTGYDIDVERLTFLDHELRQNVQRLGRAPKLSASFETSVPGLSMIGPASTSSFGPLFRFVAGSKYAAAVVSAHLASEAKNRS